MKVKCMTVRCVPMFGGVEDKCEQIRLILKCTKQSFARKVSGCFVLLTKNKGERLHERCKKKRHILRRPQPHKRQ